MEALKNEELLKLAREDSNLEAKEFFFQRNDRFCYHIAKKYTNIAELDDLVSLAKIGMLKAFNTFDLTKGFKFATYAARLMINEILMFNRKNIKHRNVDSIHNVLNYDDTGNEMTLEDIIPTPEKDGFKKEDFEVLAQILAEFSKTACDRDKQILKLYYYDGAKQQEIAKTLEISQSYVSRIITRIERKLKKIGTQITGIKGEKKKMTQTKIGREGFLYIFQNYNNLNNSQIARVLDITPAAVGNHKAKYNKDEYCDLIPTLSDELKAKFDKVESIKRAKIVISNSIPENTIDTVAELTKEIAKEITNSYTPEEPDFSFKEIKENESIILNNKIDIMSNSSEAATLLYGIYQLISSMPSGTNTKINLNLEVIKE